MNYCPNCGTILKENEDTCPNCHTKIIIEEIEVKEEIKPTKKEPVKKPPQKKTKPQKRTKFKTDKVQVKEIPLTVKKTSKHKLSDKDLKEYMMNNREDVDKYYKQDEFVFNISSLIKIIAVIALFILTVYIIFHTAIDSSKKPTVEPTKPTEKVTIYNSWESSNGGEFIFKKDDTFYWFKTINDDQNYYSGKYTYKTGLDAINDMGYNEQEFRKNFGDDIALEDVYSIEIIPNKAIIAGKDVTSTSIKPNTTWWYILIIRPDGSAMSYNKTLDVRYDLKIKTD